MMEIGFGEGSPIEGSPIEGLVEAECGSNISTINIWSQYRPSNK